MSFTKTQNKNKISKQNNNQSAQCKSNVLVADIIVGVNSVMRYHQKTPDKQCFSGLFIGNLYFL